MPIKSILIVLIVPLLFCSCLSTGPVVYFQDLQEESAENKRGEQSPEGSGNGIPLLPELKIRAHDKLSIVIHSKDPQLAHLFNLPIVTHRTGSPHYTAYNTTQQLAVYTVDHAGEIDFPVLGKIHVEGKSREEIANGIKRTLLDENLVKDPVVTVEFINLGFSVLGEVHKPGRFAIDRDQLTLLDALGLAGDLTIYGKREQIRILRNEGGRQTVYSVNLTSARQLCLSPAYYVQQNDVIYVQPNTVRERQSTVNGNNIRSTSFWLSLASLLTTITVLIVK